MPIFEGISSKDLLVMLKYDHLSIRCLWFFKSKDHGNHLVIVYAHGNHYKHHIRNKINKFYYNKIKKDVKV